MKLSALLIAVVSSLTILASLFSPVVAQEVTSTVVVTVVPSPTCAPLDSTSTTPNPCVQVNEKKLGFKIPTLSTILTFVIRAIFVIGGLLALVMLLLGAIAWITSGGEKENVSKAQNKLQAAVVGIILIAVVLAIIATLEQVIFKGTICLGLTCPITVPSLLEKTNEGSTTGIAPATAVSPTIELSPTPASAVNLYNTGQTEQNSANGDNNQSSQTEQQSQQSGGILPTAVILPDTGGHPR